MQTEPVFVSTTDPYPARNRGRKNKTRLQHCYKDMGKQIWL